jgi:hypothetical protein
VNCEISMHERMPSYIIWASPGGIAPKERVVIHVLSCNPLHENDQGRDTGSAEKETWIEGAGKTTTRDTRTSWPTVRRGVKEDEGRR